MGKHAVLLVNLGSPNSPEEPDVKRFIQEFLMDKFVIDIPWFFRKLLVSFICYSGKIKNSSKAYKSIWFSNGSPLIVLSKQLAKALEKYYKKPVFLAMRYGNPALSTAIYKLKDRTDIDEVLVLPLYPHFATSTVHTIIEETKQLWKKYNIQQKLSFFSVFYDNSYYINALVQSAKPWLDKEYDHILFSYHSIPLRHLKKADPTACHCLTPNCCAQLSFAHKTCYKHHVIETTKAFVKATNIASDKYSIAYQSKLGRAKWIEPTTESAVIKLANQNIKKLLVICPAFLVDCVETLEEIEIGIKETFINAGGETLEMIPCLNNQPFWIENLSHMIANHMKDKQQASVAVPLYT